MTKMTVAYKQELETGPAKILCCVDGSVSAYDAEIVKIDLNHEDTNKSFVIRVIDPDLLEKNRRDRTGNEWKPGDPEREICRGSHPRICTGFYKRLWN